MKLIQGQMFRDLKNRDGTFHVTDTEFRRCLFDGCICSTDNVEFRPSIRNVKLKDCHEWNSHIWEAVIQDTEVDGVQMNTAGLFIISDCAYRHVVLKGKLGRMKITSGLTGQVRKLPTLQWQLSEENSNFYKTVEWALDISQAEFQDFSVSGVPLSLIRRDEETQVVLPAELATSGAWREVKEFDAVWGRVVNALVKVREEPDLLLVAAKRNRNFRAERSALTALRKSGLLSS